MKACYALVGMQHRDKVEPGTSEFVKTLADQEEVTLIREPTNAYDRNAIQIWARGRHIGYLAKKQIAKLALALDNGTIGMQIPVRGNSLTYERGMKGKFCARNGERWPLIEVEE